MRIASPFGLVQIMPLLDDSLVSDMSTISVGMMYMDFADKPEYLIRLLDASVVGISPYRET